MKKLKLYFDTSVISHLFAEDALAKKEDTLQLWREAIKGKFDVYLSPTVMDELSDCPEPKLGKMLAELDKIEYTMVELSDDVARLAQAYRDNAVLPKGSINDSLHIACAVIQDCDLIVSWNFKHMANERTNNGVKIVNTMNNYKEIRIIIPSNIIENPKA